MMIRIGFKLSAASAAAAPSSTSSFAVAGVAVRAFSATAASNAESLPLEGKRALVTGSTSGIGLGIANVLASKGASVMLNGLSDGAKTCEDVKKVAQKAGAGAKISFCSANMMTEDGVKMLCDKTVEDLGGCDILVNNAGIQHVSPIHEFASEDWDRVININLRAAYLATRFLLPAMLDAKFGRIINIASVHGLVGSINKSAYVASKHAVVGMSKVTALETAGKGVTVNSICPGWVLTPLVEKQVHARAEVEGVTFDEAVLSLLAEKQPSMQFATPEEIGELAAFLSSDAARQITGAAIPVDGGWTAV